MLDKCFMVWSDGKERLSASEGQAERVSQELGGIIISPHAWASAVRACGMPAEKEHDAVVDGRPPENTYFRKE